MEVGVRELKAKLSQYLARAAAGEHVVVTDRGRPVARLVPLVDTADLDQGIAEGWVEPPRRTALGEPLLFETSTRIADTLGDDRGD
ncbi:MAG: type II toxin-antitoxin system prevent-host-death family antitoxin [Actinomycetota bacterium]